MCFISFQLQVLVLMQLLKLHPDIGHCQTENSFWPRENLKIIKNGFTQDTLRGMGFTVPEDLQLNFTLLQLQPLPIVCNSKNVS